MGFPLHGVTQGELIEALARERPEREALVYPGGGPRMTFADLERRSRELACGLIALGIEPGERVVVWSDNAPDWIPMQFALARVGAVMVTANTALTKFEIGYLLKQSRSVAIVTARGLQGAEYMEAIAELRAAGELRELRHVVVMEGDPAAGMLALHAVVEQGRRVPDDEVSLRTGTTPADAPTNIQYTSGTTGFPKGVVLTHTNIVENAYNQALVYGTTDTDRLLLQVPLFHCFGCVIAVLGAYTFGIPVIALRRFDPAAALDAIESERCTIIHGVPTMFRAILEEPDWAEHDLGSLRTGLMAGSMCPEPLMRRVVDDLGCEDMLVAYGLTEASPAVASTNADDPLEVRCGSVGRAIPGVELRVVDPATAADLPLGATGELWARGPNVMQGYFEMPEATAETITDDGWLRTGDLATLDADGLVRIQGRIKEMIIRGGENVYPAEVEDALREHPAIRDAAVFGVPSEHWGEEVAAAVILERDDAVDADSLEAFLTNRLARFKRPEHVAFVDAFPLTGSGKVRKFQLPGICGLG